MQVGGSEQINNGESNRISASPNTKTDVTSTPSATREILILNHLDIESTSCFILSTICTVMYNKSMIHH
jgi:hypothetical protein